MRFFNTFAFLLIVSASPLTYTISEPLDTLDTMLLFWGEEMEPKMRDIEKKVKSGEKPLKVYINFLLVPVLEKVIPYPTIQVVHEIARGILISELKLDVADSEMSAEQRAVLKNKMAETFSTELQTYLYKMLSSEDIPSIGWDDWLYNKMLEADILIKLDKYGLLDPSLKSALSDVEDMRLDLLAKKKMAEGMRLDLLARRKRKMEVPYSPSALEIATWTRRWVQQYGSGINPKQSKKLLVQELNFMSSVLQDPAYSQQEKDKLIQFWTTTKWTGKLHSDLLKFVSAPVRDYELMDTMMGLFSVSALFALPTLREQYRRMRAEYRARYIMDRMNRIVLNKTDRPSPSSRCEQTFSN